MRDFVTIALFWRVLQLDMQIAAAAAPALIPFHGRLPQGPGKALAHAILLWLFPVPFFFSFLLYTDPGATFFILLCYLLATGPPKGGGWGRRCGSALVSVFHDAVYLVTVFILELSV